MNDIQIKIIGPVCSGKTALMQLIAQALRDFGASNVAVEWGRDGNPGRSNELAQQILSRVSGTTAFAVSEEQTARAACAIDPLQAARELIANTPLITPQEVTAKLVPQLEAGPVDTGDKRNYDVKVETKNYTVEVSTSSLYGWFERNSNGDGGGLWFEPEISGAPDGTETPTGKLQLRDYDGVCVLPMQVILALRTHGFVVDKDFE